MEDIASPPNRAPQHAAPGRAFAALIAEGLDVLRRLGSVSLALDPGQQTELGRLNHIEQRLAELMAQTGRPDLEADVGLRRRLARFRTALQSCDWRIRSQSAAVGSALNWMRGGPIDAGVYKPGPPRRSSAGAWMNVRSSP